LGILEKPAQLTIFDRNKAGKAVHILTFVINPHTGSDAILETHSVGEGGAQRPLLGDIPIPASILREIFVNALQKIVLNGLAGFFIRGKRNS